ncbi:fkbI [Rhodococcus sp. MTM3W5.2]|uniref:acyl-CoA dehydrogenase family protein n=1 Tax=Rhodococcus sp. MTM3W5.2 TaxID=1805827 RepID=UPI00097912C8|nr:acyl-CoA dehydrogenase family protein [Rhodococcus sp. MTM3W5.2]AQA20679.1 fkbI [Rhodococcus sp. MTM3W5.2]
MPDSLDESRAAIDTAVGDHAESWDRTGLIPLTVLRELGTRGLLCAQVPIEHGGIGYSSLLTGRLAAHTGSRCSSLRSVMTSQGMAAWTIQRMGDAKQRRRYLTELTGGSLAAVGFSEPESGSDLSTITTRIVQDGDSVVLTGHKVWMTAAHYADLLVTIARYGDEAAAVVVPATAAGVRVERIADPLGCRAAGHSDVQFDEVRLPVSSVLGGGGQSLPMLITTALAYGRMSVAWGCAGILRACLAEATAHARSRKQFGKPLAEHQLIGRHLAELLVAEQVTTRTCEHASRSWDSGAPELVIDSVLAKHVGASNAVRGATSAVQVLASGGARDGGSVARAYRDAKLMEIIEGSTEICQLILAQHALTLR